MKFQMLVDHMRKEYVCLEFVCSEDMAAELLTKNLSFSKSQYLMKISGLNQW